MTGSIEAAYPRTAAASLYRGVVMHARLKPIGHRFNYRVASLAIDLDRLGEADAQSALFSVNRRNLFAFHEADHGQGDGAPLRPWVDALLREAGVELGAGACASSCEAGDGGTRSTTDEGGDEAQTALSRVGTSRLPPIGAGSPPAPQELGRPRGRIVLLCYPRIFGYVFDPLSVYFCYGDGGAVAAVIYEVRNTFGERHAYVAPVRAGEASEAGIRQDCRKLFHVSPFLGMRAHYKFRLHPPAETVSVRILECDDGGPILAATFFGRRSRVATAALLGAFGVIPLQSLKIIVGIHWEALKLWRKGARYQKRPPAPSYASLDGRMIGERLDLSC